MSRLFRFVRTASALSLLAAAHAAAQSSVIGRTIDAGAHTGLGGVRVSAHDQRGNEQRVTISDSTGAFALPLPPGTFTLRAQRIGYASADTRTFELQEEERLEVLLQLAIQPIGLDPLIIVSSRRTTGRLADYYARLERENLQGRFITRAQLDSVDMPGITSYIEHAGVVMLVGRRGEKWPLGTGRCRMRVFLDDVPIDGFVIDMLIRPQEVEGVEIYRSAYEAPPRYSARMNTCGIVLIWTRMDKRGTLTIWRGLLVAVTGLSAAFLLRRAWIN